MTAPGHVLKHVPQIIQELVINERNLEKELEGSSVDSQDVASKKLRSVDDTSTKE